MELCIPCNNHFPSKKALHQHERDSPIHKKTFHCRNCDQSFRNDKKLKNHRKLCQNAMSLPPGRVDTPLNQGYDDGVSSNTSKGEPAADPQSLLVDQFARMLVSAVPITTLIPSKKSKHSVPKLKQETREFFTFSDLHTDVADAVYPDVSSPWFNVDADDDDYSDNSYTTHVMGKFVCNNKACQKQGWGSKKVPTEIKGYARNGYSAIVYNQRCKSCNHLGTFELDEGSYVERVAYRLKKWAGVKAEVPYFNRIKTKPHERDYCEGCKRGKCEEEDEFEFY